MFKIFIILIALFILGIYYLTTLALREKFVLKLVNSVLKLQNERFVETLPKLKELVAFCSENENLIKFDVTGTPEFINKLNSILVHNKEEQNIKTSIIELIQSYNDN